MPVFQRFDLEGESHLPVITDHEMKRRWAAFHGDMRKMSGKWWQRILGQLLGEDTRRYRVARRVGRPLLQFLRGARASRQGDEPSKATAQFASGPTRDRESTVFPINYSPKTAVRFINLASFKVPTDDVTTVVVDERLAASDAIAAVNAVLDSATTTWLFLCDATSTNEERATTLLALFNNLSDADVLFADEDGPNVFAPLFKFPSVPPHTLLSYNVVGRPALIRVTALRGVGGVDPNAGWAFERDAYRLDEARRGLSTRQPGVTGGASQSRLRTRPRRRRYVPRRRASTLASRLARRSEGGPSARPRALDARRADTATLDRRHHPDA